MVHDYCPKQQPNQNCVGRPSRSLSKGWLTLRHSETVKAPKEAGGKEANHVFFHAYVAKEDGNESIEVDKMLFDEKVAHEGIKTLSTR